MWLSVGSQEKDAQICNTFEWFQAELGRVSSGYTLAGRQSVAQPMKDHDMPTPAVAWDNLWGAQGEPLCEPQSLSCHSWGKKMSKWSRTLRLRNKLSSQKMCWVSNGTCQNPQAGLMAAEARESQENDNYRRWIHFFLKTGVPIKYLLFLFKLCLRFSKYLTGKYSVYGLNLANNFRRDKVVNVQSLFPPQ